MNKKTTLALIGLISILFFSCENEPKKEIQNIFLERNIEMDRLSDSTFIADVRSLDTENGDIYLTDYKRNEIIMVDENFNLLNTLGSGGRGPGEFVGASVIQVFEDSIFVANDGKRSIEVFKDDAHIETMEPEASLLETTSKFTKLNNSLYFSTRQSSENIAIYKNGKVVETFGRSKKYPTETATRIKNQKHILSSNGNILAVSNNRPVVETYDPRGNYMAGFNYGDVPIISQTMDFIEKQDVVKNSFYAIVNDAFVHADKLYLLMLTIDAGTEERNNNKILEIELTNDDFEVSRILHLGEGWFNSFCVSDDFLIASTRQKVIKYEL